LLITDVWHDARNTVSTHQCLSLRRGMCKCAHVWLSCPHVFILGK
jgi:hypothetical protein